MSAALIWYSTLAPGGWARASSLVVRTRDSASFGICLLNPIQSRFLISSHPTTAASTSAGKAERLSMLTGSMLKDVMDAMDKMAQSSVQVSVSAGKAERLSMLTDSVLKDIMDAVDKAAKSGGLRPQRVDLKQLLPIQRC